MPESSIDHSDLFSGKRGGQQTLGLSQLTILSYGTVTDAHLVLRRHSGLRTVVCVYGYYPRPVGCTVSVQCPLSKYEM